MAMLLGKTWEEASEAPVSADEVFSQCHLHTDTVPAQGTGLEQRALPKAEEQGLWAPSAALR